MRLELRKRLHALRAKRRPHLVVGLLASATIFVVAKLVGNGDLLDAYLPASGDSLWWWILAGVSVCWIVAFWKELRNGFSKVFGLGNAQAIQDQDSSLEMINSRLATFERRHKALDDRVARIESNIAGIQTSMNSINSALSVLLTRQEPPKESNHS